MKTYALLISTLLSTAPVYAGNSLCQKARVASVTVYHGEEHKELCQLKESELNVEYKNILQEIESIHLSAAKLLNASLKKLIPDPFDVYLYNSVSGMNGSAKKTLINVTTYPSSPVLLNKGIYAHEFGHWLTLQENPLIPAALIETDRNSFGETIADTIALALVGEDTSPIKTLPACFSEARVRPNQSYAMPAAFFDGHQNMRDMKACCKKNSSLNKNTRAICDNYFTDEGGAPVKIPAGDKRPFNSVKDAHYGAQEHRIGVPFNSLLMTLGNETKKNLFQSFVANFSKAKKVNYRCQITGLSKTVDAYAHSLVEQLKTLRESLLTPEKKKFDALWVSLGLDLFSIIDEADMPDRAATGAKKQLHQWLTGTEKEYCIDAIENAQMYGTDDTCEIKCSRK